MGRNRHSNTYHENRHLVWEQCIDDACVAWILKTAAKLNKQT